MMNSFLLSQCLLFLQRSYVKDLSEKQGDISDPPQFLTKEHVPASSRSHEPKCLPVARDQISLDNGISWHYMAIP